MWRELWSERWFIVGYAAFGVLIVLLIVRACAAAGLVQTLGVAPCTDSGTSCAITTTATASVGNSIVVGCVQNASVGTVSVSDGTAYTARKDQSSSANNLRTYLYDRLDIGLALPSGSTITVTHPASSGARGCVAEEYAGLQSVDTTGAVNQSNVSSLQITSGSAGVNESLSVAVFGCHAPATDAISGTWGTIESGKGGTTGQPFNRTAFAAHYAGTISGPQTMSAQISSAADCSNVMVVYAVAAPTATPTRTPTATFSPTITATKTPTPSVTPTLTPAGLQCAQFHPPSVADDGYAFYPSGDGEYVSIDVSDDVLAVSRSVFNGVQITAVGLLHFNTCGLPDDAVMTNAQLTLPIETIVQDEPRSLAGEWRSTGPPITTADWTSGSSGSAFSIALAEMEATTTVELTDAANNISLTGFTNLRLTISGGPIPTPTPSGNGIRQAGVQIAARTGDAGSGSTLTVCFVRPTPTP